MKFITSWTFRWWEIGLLKVCLVSFGIILGVYFFDALQPFLWLWWVLFGGLALYFIARWLKEAM